MGLVSNRRNPKVLHFFRFDCDPNSSSIRYGNKLIFLSGSRLLPQYSWLYQISKKETSEYRSVKISKTETYHVQVRSDQVAFTSCPNG